MRCRVKLAACTQSSSEMLLNGLVVMERRKGDCEPVRPTFWTGLGASSGG